jgi:HD-GYP domain-containing protein (c-di-GMP phosphodiesterase class II)
VVKRIALVWEAREIARPVCLLVVAMGALAVATGAAGWSTAGVAAVAASVAVAALLVLQVRSAAMTLRHESRRARRAAAEAESHYIQVLRRIIAYVEARDKYWRGHSENVGRLARRIAGELHLPEETCGLLELAGWLHDIGLLAVPESVVKGFGRFGVEEYRSVQKHSEASYEVLRPLETLAEVLPAIRHHHERMNGTGYPAGLPGEQIPLGGKILAVADAYDAMTHDRPHRGAMTPLAAMRELRRCSPSGFDPRCVEALTAVMNMPALEEAVNSGPSPGLAAAAV